MELHLQMMETSLLTLLTGLFTQDKSDTKVFVEHVIHLQHQMLLLRFTQFTSLDSLFLYQPNRLLIALQMD